MRSVRDWIAGAPTAALAAALAGIVVGAALFGFAIAELTGDDGGGGGPTTERQAPAVVGGSTQGSTQTVKRGQTPFHGSVPSWPTGLAAYTVVLISTTERADALVAARDARRGGLDAGVMPAAPYGLGSEGEWLVYAGHFATRAGADDLAEQLAVRFPDERVELVQSPQ